METALIGMGSNLGDRAALLEAARERLVAAEGIRWVRMSAVRETAPVGGPVGEPEDGPLGGPYLNAACLVLTRLQPRELLELCQAIEIELGRERSHRNAPRTLDLDLLLYGDLQLEEPSLIIPHPRLLARGFVLEPLAEIAPGRRHPGTGKALREHWEEWKTLHDRGP